MVAVGVDGGFGTVSGTIPVVVIFATELPIRFVAITENLYDVPYVKLENTVLKLEVVVVLVAGIETRV